jgi:cell division protein FtsB
MTTQTTLNNTAPATELAALKAENEALTHRLEKLDSEKAKKALKKHSRKFKLIRNIVLP